MKKETGKEKDIISDANIVEEANNEIMDRPINEKEIREVTDDEIEQANTLINPDPNSLDRG